MDPLEAYTKSNWLFQVQNIVELHDYPDLMKRKNNEHRQTGIFLLNMIYYSLVMTSELYQKQHN